MVSGDTLMSLNGTLTISNGTKMSTGSTLMVSGGTLMVSGSTLMVDHRLHWLRWTIDQKWKIDRMFNRDFEFHAHVNIEKEPCVSLYFILYCSMLMDLIC
jgi:hypothetical protein